MSALLGPSVGVPLIVLLTLAAWLFPPAEPGRYAVRASSTLLPGLDFGILARYAVREDTPQALREYDAAVRG